MNISLKPLTVENFSDYESLTSCQSGGGCFCSFWHQKWNSMSDWEQNKKEAPEINRSMVYEKVRSGFHVGVLAYSGSDLVGWISVGTLPEFYWTWRRVAQVGECARDIAGIVCFTISSKYQNQGLQKLMLEELKSYGRSRGWKTIEGYPFDQSAIEKHKEHVRWPGLTKGFVDAGFEHAGPHWLSNPEAERSIYRVQL